MVGDKKKTQFQRVKPGQQVRVAWKSGKIDPEVGGFDLVWEVRESSLGSGA